MKKDPNHCRIFDKEPQVFYKPGPKAVRDHGIHGQAMADDFYPEESGNALRRRSPIREPVAHLQPHYLEPMCTNSEGLNYMGTGSMTEGCEGEEGIE